MKNRRRVGFSFSLKLRIIIAVSILVPSLIGVLALSAFTENEILKGINTSSEVLLNQLASQLDTVILDRLQSSVAFLSEEESILDSDSTIRSYVDFKGIKEGPDSDVQKRIKRTFENFKKNNSYINFLFMGLDNGSYMEYPDFVTDRPYDHRVKNWYKDTISSGSLLISDPYITSVTGEKVIAVTKAIRTSNGQIGVVGLTVNLTDIIQSIEGLDLDNQGQLILLNNRHQMVYNSFELDPNNQVSDLSFLAGLDLDLKGFFAMRIGGLEFYRKAIVTPDYGWHVLAFYPKAEILDDINKVTLFMSVGLLAFVAIVLLIIRLMTSTMTEPILDLVQFVENADGEGFQINSRMRKDLYRQDEIGLISRALFSVVFTLRKVLGLPVDAFDFIAHELEETNEEAKHSNSGTEKLVVETFEKVKKQADEHEKNADLLSVSKRALETSELRLRMAVQISNDGFWDWKTSQESLYINTRLYEIVHSDQALELTSLRDLERLFVEADQTVFSSGLEKILSGEMTHYEEELRIKKSQEGYQWVLSRIQCIESREDGKPLWIMGTLIDIESRKAKEAFLNDENQKLGEMVEYRTRELMSLNEALLDLNAEMIESNQRLNLEIGERRVTEHKLEATNKELSFALKTIQETTEQLIQAEKLSSLGILISGVAHEVNTPLGIAVTLGSYIKELQTDLSGIIKNEELSENNLLSYIQDSGEALKLLNVNIEKAAKLIQSFKNISADQYSEDIRSFNVLEYTRDILMSLQPVFKKTSLQVSIDCPSDLMMLSYPGAFSQVLTNLLINSVVHGYPEKQIGQITVDISPIRGGVKIMYKDDGIGISDDIKSKIFDPFYTTKRGGGSTGLGLYLVHSLVVQQFNGQIKLVQQNKRGVAFSLKLYETNV